MDQLAPLDWTQRGRSECFSLSNSNQSLESSVMPSLCLLVNCVLSMLILDPQHIRSYTASRLIPLDKNPGVRPVGVGEVLRRIVGKSITTSLKPELIESTGPIQMCAGIKGGVEAAVHA